MFEKLEEVKVLRDPIHEYVHVDLTIIWDCIDAREMQRLRRIRQLGGAFQVYHTAEHSRFAHSLGVYEIVRRMVYEIKGLSDTLSEYEKVTVMLAGLLHDIGHGPFSHAFESLCATSHEEFTRLIVLDSKSDIHKILKKRNPKLPWDVASVINHTHPNPILIQMISGQLDADRMDYLLRDAYFTGTKYGEFDLERILRTIRVQDGRMVVKESGIHTVEDYIMARYHMYWQVYYHPVVRSFEAVLTMLFQRMKDLGPDCGEPGIEVFRELLTKKEMSVKEHFYLDEAACYYGFSLMRLSRDSILRDLSHRLLDRELFEYETIVTEDQLNQKRQSVINANYDPRYYFAVDDAKQRPYQPYRSQEDSLIWVTMTSGKILELSEASVIVSALVQGQTKNDPKMYFPRNC